MNIQRAGLTLKRSQTNRAQIAWLCRDSTVCPILQYVIQIRNNDDQVKNSIEGGMPLTTWNRCRKCSNLLQKNGLNLLLTCCFSFHVFSWTGLRTVRPCIQPTALLLCLLTGSGGVAFTLAVQPRPPHHEKVSVQGARRRLQSSGKTWRHPSPASATLGRSTAPLFRWKEFVTAGPC